MFGPYSRDQMYYTVLWKSTVKIGFEHDVHGKGHIWTLKFEYSVLSVSN